MAQEAHKPKVLVADDSRVVREAVTRFLGDEFELEGARDGQEAWEMLCADPSFDLLITDISMPRMDGYTLILRVRDSDPGGKLHRIPIVVITGLEDEVVRIRAFACGADDFIPKPLRRETLGADVRQHLARHATGPRGTAGGRRLATWEDLVRSGEEAVRQHAADGTPLAVVSLQLSPLSELQETFGDETVQHLRAWLFQLLLRRSSTTEAVAQLEHCAFAVLAPGTGSEGAMILAERYYSGFATEPYPDPRVAGVLKPKIGYAVLGDEETRDFAGLLALADLRRDTRRQLVEMGVDESVIEAPGLERALDLIAAGRDGELFPYSLDLAARVLPLLDLCNEQQELGLDEVLSTVHRRLQERLG